MPVRSKVLVVDDDGALLRLLSRLLDANGLTGIHLSDGDRVLEVAIDQQPDLILLDVGLPSADGRDVLRALKAHPDTFRIPVFVHTGRSSQEDRTAAFELGADDYFEKPFDPHMLTRRIAHRIVKLGAE